MSVVSVVGWTRNAGVEPVKLDVTRSSVWTAAAFAAGVVFLAGVSVWFAARGGLRSESTTGVSDATASTIVPVTNPANEASGTEPEKDHNPFVGRWEATDLDGSLLNLRVDEERTFSFWDSASKACLKEGFEHSPETWAGTATFTMTERPSFIDDMVGEGNNSEPTLTMSGAVTCHPYDSKSGDIAERSAVYYYDPVTDRLEPAGGGVRFKRSYPDQGVAVDEHQTRGRDGAVLKLGDG